MGPYAGVDSNLTLCPLQSRLQHIFYHGQPYARVDFIPQSGTMDFASGDNLRCSTVQYCEFPLAEDKKSQRALTVRSAYLRNTDVHK
jgi:hypothetical protein